MTFGEKCYRDAYAQALGLIEKIDRGDRLTATELDGLRFCVGFLKDGADIFAEQSKREKRRREQVEWAIVEFRPPSYFIYLAAVGRLRILFGEDEQMMRVYPRFATQAALHEETARTTADAANKFRAWRRARGTP